MRLVKTILICLCLQVVLITPLWAGNFGWMHDLSVQAKSDVSGFRARLGARFHIGDVQIDAVLNKVNGYADAYMVLRLGEMSGHSIDYVLEQYHVKKSQGWGVLAKSLGIKPGSKEFHRLKRRHDLDGYAEPHHGQQGKSKGKGKKQKE